MFCNVRVYFVRFCLLISYVVYLTNAGHITLLEDNIIRNYTRLGRQAKNCRDGEFQCKSGSCIPEDYQCDGKVHCPDESDETEDVCSQLRCNLFRCSYGACISKKLVCNGVKDCRDNSDETLPSCQTRLTTPIPLECGSNKFQCKSGQCIEDSKSCDGKADCDDSSDETKENCARITCPQQLLFRCNYGGCVEKKNRCNGVRDCIDGSDEVNCPGVPKPTPAPTTTSTTTEENTGVDPISSEDCTVPPHPANGAYILGDGSSNPGIVVKQYSALIIKCRTTYKPNPPQMGKYPVCILGQWSLPPPTCSRACPTLESSITTKITCRLNGKKLDSCSDPVEGTIAILSCEDLYEEPGITRNPNRVCRDGSWDYPISRCLPICGEKVPKGVTNIIGGQLAKIGEYPWQVGVYNSDRSHICGGSLLSQRVVLSAAHCFANSDGKVFPKENYLIATGKYYRGYNDSRDVNAQYSRLKAIHVPERYRGLINSYEADIAVIILETRFEITTSVQPVCVDWNTEFEYKQLSENNLGTVVGWGFTAEGTAPSEELKEIQVPYKSYGDCFEQVPVAFRKFLTHDKVCAGFLAQNQAVCSGDSGGGLTFPWDQARYYIRGIVSTSPTSKTTGIVTCDRNQYGTYTLVSKYIDFIRDLEIANRT